MKIHFTYRTFLIVTLLLASLASRAQTTRNLYFELGGSGGLASINFEKPLWVPSDYGPKFRDMCGSPPHSGYYFGWRFGFSMTPIDKNNGVALIFPVMVNWIYGCGKHKLELGAGLAPAVTTKAAFYIKSPLVLGYRFEPKDKKWFARVSYTPIVGWLVDYQWQHWAGISLGYKLGGKHEE